MWRIAIASAVFACAALMLGGAAGAAHRSADGSVARQVPLELSRFGSTADARRPPRLPGYKIRWSRQSRAPRSLAATGTFLYDHAVVGITPGTSVAAVASRFGLRIASTDAHLHVAALAGDRDRLRDLARAVGADPTLRFVETDRQLEPLHRRNDPATTDVDPATGLPYEWPFAQVGLDRALNVTKGSSDILVGVVDSGISQVRDLSGKVANKWYFSGETASGDDTVGHGTFVSSIIAGTNDDGFGVAGFCGACRLDVFKNLRMTDLTVAIAIRQLVDDGVRIINLSLGRDGGASFVAADAMSYAIAHGVLVVAAAGNDGVGNVSWPAWWLQPENGALGYGLAVGASDRTGARAGFSNWGSRLSLLAPGAFDSSCTLGIWAALPPISTDFDGPGACARTFAGSAGGGRYAYASGTSFAAPEVAGIAALVWAARPGLKNYEVANILLKSATRPAGAAWQPDRGWGVVDAARALELATGRSTADQVVVAAPQFSSAPRAGRLFTIHARTAWQDGVALDQGTAHCTAAVGARRFASVGGTLSGGTASCAYRIPSWAAGQRMTVHVAVTDAGGNATDRTARFSVRK